MKMTSCYLKALKFAMYFSLWFHQATDFRLPAAGREAIEVN